MNFQFTHPYWLLLLVPGLAWVLWFAIKTDVQISPWRRYTSAALRLIILILLVSAIAGAQWLRPLEGMNVFYLLDRSDSVPSSQQESARDYINRSFKNKKETDKGGVLVFGTDAGLEFSPNPIVDLQKIQAVVGTERTDIAGAIRLATAAFPETGQKRIVLMSDGNENIGDAIGAVNAAKPLGVTIDVVPVGATRGQDVSVQKISLPNNLKKGQTFNVKSRPGRSTRKPPRCGSTVIRVSRPREGPLTQERSLFEFAQTLDDRVLQLRHSVKASRHAPQNNRRREFHLRPRRSIVLIVSSDPANDSVWPKHSGNRVSRCKDRRSIALAAIRSRKCRLRFDLPEHISPQAIWAVIPCAWSKARFVISGWDWFASAHQSFAAAVIAIRP
jgi:hypothetical protein